MQCLICAPFFIQELSATERYQNEDSYYEQLEKERRLCFKKYIIYLPLNIMVFLLLNVFTLGFLSSNVLVADIPADENKGRLI